MNTPETTAQNLPQAPKPKKGCGCFLWTCLTALLVTAVLVISTGVAFWYGMKKINVPDEVVIWTYQNVARPKIIENLPPNFTDQQREQVLLLMDSGVEKYLKLPPEKKKILLKEVIIASYYYSEHRVIPPEKIPHLSKFVKEHLQSFQENGKLPQKSLGP